MTEPREIEAKFEATPETIDRLLSLEDFGDYRLQAFSPVQQDDLYFDTEDSHVRKSRSSLRIRRRGAQTLMTFKGARERIGDAGNTVSRLEDEVELPAESLPPLATGAALDVTPEPSPLKRARVLAGHRPLRPVARLLTMRTVMLARNDAGTEVEFAIDRCTAERLRDGRRVEFVEVEAELKQGDIAALNDAALQLQQALPGLRPSKMTKMKRALD